MVEILRESLIDILKILPWLFLTYAIIELIEYRYGNTIRDNVQHAGKKGPIIGALAGIVPQCSFSVVGTALYGQRLATIGTLIAIYIATSDEAIPVILSQPEHIGVILPLLLTKFVLAVVVGFLIDLFYRRKNKKIIKHIANFEAGHDDASHNHKSLLKVEACCGHDACAPKKRFELLSVLYHPFIHTLKIGSYVLLMTILIGLAYNLIGAETLKLFLGEHLFLQPVFVGLFGLIPNCAVSVAITQLYLDGIITFGSVIAGLSASGGLGILILFRVEKNIYEVLKIISLLFGFSVLAGVIINYF
ncbi:MAG: putative manganese transporter [bacterium]